MKNPIESLCGRPDPHGIWNCPTELYTRRMMIDMFISRSACRDHIEELVTSFDIGIVGLASEYPNLECDTFVFGRGPFQLVRNPENDLWVPEQFVPTITPDAGDIAVYYFTSAAPPSLRQSIVPFLSNSASADADRLTKLGYPTHYGIVAERTETQIVIHSKWGETDVYRHALWDVISPYGNAALFFKRP